MITCSKTTNKIIYVEVPDMAVETQMFLKGNERQTENQLLNVKNPANAGIKKYATVRDTKRDTNTMPFRNCLVTNPDGIIFPLDTEQGVSEEDIIDEIKNVKEEKLRLIEEEEIEAVGVYIKNLRRENSDVEEFLKLLGMRKNSGSYSDHGGRGYYGLYQIEDITFKQIKFMDKSDRPCKVVWCNILR